MDDASVTPAKAPPFDGELRRLEPAVRWAWLAGGLVGALVLSATLVAVDLVWASEQTWWRPGPGVVGGLLAGLVFGRALIHPFLRWPRFRYAVGERDLSVEDGVLWRSWSTVPRSRVQHVEVNAGPVDRLLGIATLEVYTAGTGSADLEIPGLSATAAEFVRDALLAAEPPEETDAAASATEADDAPPAAATAPAGPPHDDLAPAEVPAEPFPEPPAPESAPPEPPRPDDA